MKYNSNKKENGIITPMILFISTLILLISLNSIELNYALLKNYQIIGMNKNYYEYSAIDFEQRKESFSCKNNLCLLSSNNFYDYSNYLDNEYKCENLVFNNRLNTSFESEYDCIQDILIINEGKYHKNNLFTNNLIIRKKTEYSYLLVNGSINIRNLEIDNNLIIISNSTVKIKNINVSKTNLRMEIISLKDNLELENVSGEMIKIACRDKNSLCENNFIYLNKIESLVTGILK